MTNSQEDVRKVYEELCTSYRAIDDFRAKLLGFLPLATGTGIFLLTGSLKDVLNLATGTGGKDLTAETTTFLWAAGAFGFAITLGLFFYELYGVKKCHALIKAGQELEKDLGINAQRGQFRARPREVAGMINEPFAAGVIYPAVLAAWIFLALLFKSQDALWWAIGVFIVGFAVVFFFNLKLGKEEAVRKVLEIREEDPVTIRHHVWEYFTSKDVKEHIRNEMEKWEWVTIYHRWKYLNKVETEDTRDQEVINGKLAFAGTDVEVKSLVDYLKNGRTLDDFVEDHPTVGREQAEAFLEQAKEFYLEQTGVTA